LNLLALSRCSGKILPQKKRGLILTTYLYTLKYARN